ncbi:MAG: hypothetical protein ACD_30C00112G0033 [uncultured bacterium]|uniref:Uncharacterized protein n=4 Tax=Candidatus Daviesiibacteriota TaxID=1752718 RepID=A0A0G0EYE3_9BACT|nr:MAG: hypothetical protein ACD_30C00112G0033 [uncultured bacterium]KKQ10547.1 MAG: hypothetical protein US19_C0003G0042 [Candidatus Daviesbacteria bacterium GW2011_GWB1_36_5]KKQ15290.1 MAG: hypothetical protein US28_C0019G0023 [Candidatus Daviesbacteria bacterium GW2011_GWA1_36_8]OGE17192.1 MAG: hypothetical protein A2858_00615 [Candidatus Daviesbacteria bacterium RIFCSPHIGHO2_01_FULL_36_37]OGE35973.1 MAG: hypothetical protein A3E66_01610 [Candidatus Daviesbacteria bacterium RIFCSPHIGHO2_12_F
MKKLAAQSFTLKRKSSITGFTLVELLVVIAIIAILAAVVVLIINPLELTRRGRDAARLTDLANLQQAINVAVQEATTAGANIACAGAAAGCIDNSQGGSRLTDGTGWVRVNLGVQTSVSVPTLPVDPTNTAGATGLHYTYCGSGDNWEIITDLESQQQIGKEGTDGGTDAAKYEVGSVLNLLGTALPGGAGNCTY